MTGPARDLEFESRGRVPHAAEREACSLGDPAHARVLNAIRVAPADLEAFIASKRRSS